MKKRVVRLTESDLTRLVKKVIKENKNKKKLNESSDDVEDLLTDFAQLMEKLDDFVSRAEDVIDNNPPSEELGLLDDMVGITHSFLRKLNYR